MSSQTKTDQMKRYALTTKDGKRIFVTASNAILAGQAVKGYTKLVLIG